MSWYELHEHIARQARAERGRIYTEAREIRTRARLQIMWLALPVNYHGGTR